MKRLLLTAGKGLLLIAIILLPLALPAYRSSPQRQGVTFSVSQAESLGLNWRQALEAIFTELGVRDIRLVAYWSRIESLPGRYDFAELDEQMDMAQRHGVKVTLAVGQKVPRWPECHIPAFATELPAAEREAKALTYTQQVVERYKTHPALIMWQVENEPFLTFGNCPEGEEQLFERAVALVASADPSHPLLVTDSGELNWWVNISRYGDVVGTTLYRVVHSRRTDRLFAYDYIFPAWIYRAKARTVLLLRGKPVIISELQGEPWSEVPYQELSAEGRAQSFSLARFKSTAAFARRTQLPLAYWWGVEYWYWEKTTQHNDAFWETAKEIIR